MYQLLGKTQPINLARGLEDSLGEWGTISEYHPFLNLLQMYYEPSDPLTYAELVLSTDTFERPIPNLYMTWGLEDTWTPDDTIEGLAVALNIPLVEPVLRDFGQPILPLPVLGNLEDGDRPVTAAIAQFTANDRDDPHLVAFSNETARTQVLGFLESYKAIRVGQLE